MTPAEQESTLIALWNEGLELAAIAQRLGIPKGTVQSRAHRLQARGLIQPRPRGGAYPAQRVKARQEGAPSTLHPPPGTMYRPPWTHTPGSCGSASTRSGGPSMCPKRCVSSCSAVPPHADKIRAFWCKRP
jgi:hypothetical protein